jgi:hypothetical protein
MEGGRGHARQEAQRGHVFLKPRRQTNQAEQEQEQEQEQAREVKEGRKERAQHGLHRTELTGDEWSGWMGRWV